VSEPSGDDIVSSRGELLLYATDDGRSRVECRFAEDTLWLSQAAMMELYQTTRQNVSLHLLNIFREGELLEEAVVKDYLITAADGKSYRVKHYSLEAVLAVGYRVRSERGTQFRQWATARLSEYLVKGFTLDDERLKNPPGPDSPDYFDELLERIRDIRASERRMYLRVRDILALAADYRPSDQQTPVFFQTIQNKLHFAATNKTAPELIAERADATRPNMGLTTWKGGRVRKGDVTVAKNYLREEEIDELNRIVVMFLDFADDQARRRRQVFMRNWQERLDDFLRFNERDVLEGSGHVSRSEADTLAHAQYAQFEQRRRETAELAGEEDAIRALEAAARTLPDRGRKGSQK
jgi:hypothetical protein